VDLLVDFSRVLVMKNDQKTFRKREGIKIAGDIAEVRLKLLPDGLLVTNAGKAPFWLEYTDGKESKSRILWVEDRILLSFRRSEP